MRIFPLAVLLTSLALSACATTRMSESERLALYSSHAGAPVKSIRYLTPIGWEAIDEDHLLLNMRPKQVWLLRLAGPCLDWNMDTSQISFDHQPGMLSAGLDRIVVRGAPACRIMEIRPVDIVAVRAAQESLARAR